MLSAQQPRLLHLTVKDGLPGQTINKILVDRAGYLWIATENGLARYDGHRMQTWTQNEGLPDNEVLSLMEDTKGRIWMATLQDHAFIENGKVMTREEAAWIPELSGLPWVLEQLSDGRVCIGSKYGMLAFDEEHTDTIFWGSSRHRYRLVYETEANGPVPIGTSGKIYEEVFNDGVQVPGRRYEGLPGCWNFIALGAHSGIVREHEMQQMARDSAFLDAAYGKIRKACGDCGIFNLEVEADSTIWAATSGSGVMIYQPRTGKVRQILKESTIHGITTDLGGNKWIYSKDEGAYMLPYGKLDVLSYQAGKGLLANQVISLETGKSGNIYLGYGHGQVGVRSPDERLIHHVRTEGFDTRKKVREMKELENGSLMVVTDQGLYTISDPGLYTGPELKPMTGVPFFGTIIPGRYPFLFHHAIKGLTVISDTVCYIATSDGISRVALRGGKWIEEKGIRSRAYAVEAIPGTETLWVGTVDSLFICERGNNCVPAPLGNETPSLVSEVVLAPDGRVWAATMGEGLYFMHGDSILHFTTAEGLPSNVCTSLYQGGGDTLWVGTDLGLCRMVMHGTEAEFRHFSASYGLVGTYINDVIQASREVWVATPEGVSFFDPEEGRTEIPLAQIAFSQVQIRGRDTTLHAEYVLKDWQNSLVISFRDSLFQAVSYQYRMSGEDEEWVDLKVPEVSFSLLEAGKSYQLDVRAANRAGKWSAVRTLKFDIRLPFYKQTWFGLLLVLLIVGIPTTILWLRRRNREMVRAAREEFNRQLAQSRLVALKSQMNPHFLFNSLNAIQHLVIENDILTTTTYVAKFARLMRRVLDHSHSEFISLKEEVGVCELYIELEAMRLVQSFSHTVVVDPRLDPENLRVPGMILQPFIENAIWHGLMPKKEDRELRVEIWQEGENLRFTITDNGVGRQVESTPKKKKTGHHSRAVHNFEERLSLFNRAFDTQAFSLRFVDLRGEDGSAAGTQVEIKCPMLRDVDVKSNSNYA